MEDLRNLLRDYFFAYSGRSREEKRKSIGSSFYIVFCGLWPALILLDSKSGNFKLSWFTYLVVMFPTIAGIMAMANRPLVLPKIMYLCPMDGEERRKYIRNLYALRIVFHMLISFIIAVVLLFTPYCDIWTALIFLVNEFFINMLVLPMNVKETNGIYWLWFSQLIIAIFSACIVCGIIADELPDTVVKVVLLAVIVCVQLPIALANRKQIRHRMEEASVYASEIDRPIAEQER